MTRALPSPPGSWRVVVARLPEDAADPREVDGQALVHHIPILEGARWEEATELVDRLCKMGVTAAVLPEDSVCGLHPTELSTTHCQTCSTWICGQCRADAHGATACAACARKATALRRASRLRALFSLFLFAVFLFEVAAYLRSESAALNPPIRVGIVQFAPSRLIGDPRLRALNQPDDGAGRSLYDISPFYQQEHQRYTGSTEPFMQVSLRGPWTEEVRPPKLGERNAPWWRLMLASWQYPRYFHALARDHGVDPDTFGARLYIVWTDDAGDVTGDSRGSQKGRVGITWLSVDEPNPAYSVVAVAHELCHILGAIDNYNEADYLGHWPEGYVEPFANPLWPQQWAELMAVDRPTGPEAEREVRSLFEERIGYDTAARIGWIAEEQAELYYQPKLTMPEDILHQLERTRDEHPAEPQSFGPAPESMKAGISGPGPADPAGDLDPAGVDGPPTAPPGPQSPGSEAAPPAPK